MEYAKSTKKYDVKLPVNLIAQIDLFQILLRAGCSFGISNKIICWGINYYYKKPNEKLRLKYTTLSCEIFIKTFSSLGY